jgi:hypothetical protein
VTYGIYILLLLLYTSKYSHVTSCSVDLITKNISMQIDSRLDESFDLFSLLKFLMFSPLSPSHHIKYVKRHMFGVLNIGKK